MIIRRKYPADEEAEEEAEEEEEEEEEDDEYKWLVFRPFVKFTVFNDAAETEEEHAADDVPLCAAKAPPPNNIFVISISLFP